ARSRRGHALSDRRARAGRPQSRLGGVSARSPADDDDRRGLAARHASALQDRDFGDRRHGRVMASLAFVGLGAMGSRLARRLLDAHFSVAGYNRTSAKARALEAAGMKLAPTPRLAAEGAVVVFSMVTDDAALRAVALGPDGIVAGLARGAVWAEMST